MSEPVPQSYESSSPQLSGGIQTVQGIIGPEIAGYVYAHEHLIIDSPLIAAKFPDIHLFSVDTAVDELTDCRQAGVALVIDCMPCASGRDARRLAAIAQRSGVAVIASTGLHHDRYYGELHWSNHVSEDTLAELFVADIVQGIDEFDYSGPVLRRTDHRAGILKVATSGSSPDSRDRRNLAAAAQASLRTGVPILTHCEAGLGGLEQVDILRGLGVAASSIILSHVDKPKDLNYLIDLCATGAYLELDQGLRDREQGLESITVRAVGALASNGFAHQIVVGTDGARRSLWKSLGGTPGLRWLADELPQLLASIGHSAELIDSVMRKNAISALRIKAVGAAETIRELETL